MALFRLKSATTETNTQVNYGYIFKSISEFYIYLCYIVIYEENVFLQKIQVSLKPSQIKYQLNTSMLLILAIIVLANLVV